MNINRPTVETSKSIEPNDNDLELNAITYTFSKIFQPELKQSFHWQSQTSCSLCLFSLPSEANEETEEKITFSAVEDFTLLQWHSGTQKWLGRVKQSDQINNEARLFWKSIVKAKHQSLTSLTFI